MTLAITWSFQCIFSNRHYQQHIQSTSSNTESSSHPHFLTVRLRVSTSSWMQWFHHLLKQQLVLPRSSFIFRWMGWLVTSSENARSSSQLPSRPFRTRKGVAQGSVLAPVSIITTQWTSRKCRRLAACALTTSLWLSRPARLGKRNSFYHTISLLLTLTWVVGDLGFGWEDCVLQWRLVVKLAGRAAKFHLWLNIGIVALAVFII